MKYTTCFMCSKKKRGTMNTAVMFSSKTDEWSTPQDFFDELNKSLIYT